MLFKLQVPNRSLMDAFPNEKSQTMNTLKCEWEEGEVEFSCYLLTQHLSCTLNAEMEQ